MKKPAPKAPKGKAPPFAGKEGKKFPPKKPGLAKDDGKKKAPPFGKKK